MNDEKEKIGAVTDTAAQFAEQQEQRRVAFEEQQERKRHEFEAKLERQKARREWLMLIITAASVAAAAWTVREAHQSRVEAADGSAKTMEMQTARMEMDERPYITTAFSRVDEGPPWPEKKGRIVNPVLLVTTYGRTSALDIQLYYRCDAIGGLFVLNGSPPPPVSRSNPGDDYPGDWVLAAIAPGDRTNEIPCPVLLPDKPKEKELYVVYEGTVFYRDFFKKDHMTQFCWTFAYEVASGKTGAFQCLKVPLKIT